jgi:hypothetical protein
MKKYSLLYLIIGIAALFLITQKIILPLVYDVIKSDAFLVDTKDLGSPMPVTNSMTDLAFMQCNNYIKTELEPDVTATFSKKPLNSWGLGNYQYVINAEITISGPQSTSASKYACRITYENGENQEGVMDSENWTVYGIDGIEGL